MDDSRAILRIRCGDSSPTGTRPVKTTMIHSVSRGTKESVKVETHQSLHTGTFTGSVLEQKFATSAPGYHNRGRRIFDVPESESTKRK